MARRMRRVLHAKLQVRLTLLVPAVENSIAGDCVSPRRMIAPRRAHGRSRQHRRRRPARALAMRSAYAAEQKPDLILDFATLTGAARVALGPELPALFANRDDVADAAARETRDPLWRCRSGGLISRCSSRASPISPTRVHRVTPATLAGALSVEHFVPDTQAWCHLDVYSWNEVGERPGRPRGGEAQGLRRAAFLQQRYGIQSWRDLA